MTSLRARRLVYLGSPQAAVGPLQALVAAGFDIALVVSQPDRKRGRGGALVPSPVKAAALELGLSVSDQVSDVMGLSDATGVGADLGVVVAFGKLIKEEVLAEVPMVNLHFSLLPRWRGAAPVERALLAGDTETGVCLMALEAGLDTGPVYERVVTAIGEEETTDELRVRLVKMGTEMLVRNLAEGLGVPTPQDGEITYAAKIDPSELEINWNKPVEEIHRLCRAGLAWTTFRNKRLKIRRVHKFVQSLETAGMELITELLPGELHVANGSVLVGTANGMLELVEVQPEAKASQPARDWANGARLTPGERLGGLGLK